MISEAAITFHHGLLAENDEMPAGIKQSGNAKISFSDEQMYRKVSVGVPTATATAFRPCTVCGI